jgi:hypothetical protein
MNARQDPITPTHQAPHDRQAACHHQECRGPTISQGLRIRLEQIVSHRQLNLRIVKHCRQHGVQLPKLSIAFDEWQQRITQKAFIDGICL